MNNNVLIMNVCTLASKFHMNFFEQIVRADNWQKAKIGILLPKLF